MIVWSAIFVVVGGILSVGATVWLIVGLKPTNPRYGTAALQNKGLSRLLDDQRKMLFVLALGASLQLVGAILALWAAIDSTAGA
jgi:hypothetical protein